MTGRVDIFWRILQKNPKKFKLKSQELKKHFDVFYRETEKKLYFSGPVTSFLTLCTFQ